MGKKRVAALEKIDADFASLQYKCRRDPPSYRDEFEKQYDQYASQKEIFIASPASASAEQSKTFHDLIDFITHVADCYADVLSEFPIDLTTILTQHHANLDYELRDKIVGSLVLLCRKDILPPEQLLKTLFSVLVSTPSKSLRTLLFQRILSTLRNENSKSTNHRLNRTIQSVLYNLVADKTSGQGIWAVKLTKDLWVRQVWTDANPVNVMREACFSEHPKVLNGAVRFFLGGDKEREEMEDDSSDEETIDLKKIQHQNKTNKKTKKKSKQYEKAVEKVKRAERKKNQPHPLNFSALHLLNGPQEFIDKLFAQHLQNTKKKMPLELKLLVLQLVTRLVGLHKLTLISLFSWFTKYLTPKQESVTTFLACLAQATHSEVPPDAIEPLLMKIANEFVSEGSAAEVASAGLNAIREVCARQPLAMNDTLLQDLVQYRKSKDKGVTMAARGLLSLYRIENASLLSRKDRGKDATISMINGDMKVRQFGEQAEGGIEGLELLEKWKEEEKERKLEEKKRKRAEKGLPEDKDDDDSDNDSFHSEDWEVASSMSSDSGGWIEVSSEEDEPAPKKRKKGEPADDDSEDEDEEDEETAAEQAQRLSKLASTTILTPADLAKLQELRREAAVDKAMGKKSKRQKELEARHTDDGLTAEQIELPSKLRKLTKEERVALAKEGKPERGEHKSTQAIRRSKKDAEGKSSTNKEKARKKNMLMTMGKARMKQKRSLTQTRRVLKAHVERSKRGGRRGNIG